MKKILSGIVAIVVLLAMATSVNAANVAASKSEVNRGDEVTVTVDLENATGAVQFTMNYDSSVFEYVSASTGLGIDSINPQSGVIYVSSMDVNATTKKVTLTFKAKTDADYKTGAFVVSGLKTESKEELAGTTANVTVVEKQEPVQPVEPEQPENPTTPSTDNKQPTTPSTDNKGEATSNTQKTETKVDTNGNKITKLPQTGIPYVAGIVLIAVIGAVVVAAKKIVK